MFTLEDIASGRDSNMAVAKQKWTMAETTIGNLKRFEDC